MSVIDSLSAGYRFLGRRIELLLAPILLDLLFWLVPRLSIAPILQQVANFYNEATTVEGMPADMAQMTRQTATLLNQAGESSNLLSVLANTSFLHVPSLVATIGPLADQGVIEVQSPLAALLLFLGIGLLGMLVGVVYMNMLARTLPIGDGPKPASFGEFMGTVLRHWVMVVAYVTLLIFALIIGSIPVSLATAVLSMISPVIGSLIFVMLSGMMLVLFFYMYFVTAAVIMDNLPVHRAIAQSFVLVRNNFWATLGFVVLYNLITIGFAYIMASLASTIPFGTPIAILIYAYIGSGLTMALLVFYRTRLLKQEEVLLPRHS